MQAAFRHVLPAVHRLQGEVVPDEASSGDSHKDLEDSQGLAACRDCIRTVRAGKVRRVHSRSTWAVPTGRQEDPASRAGGLPEACSVHWKRQVLAVAVAGAVRTQLGP